MLQNCHSIYVRKTTPTLTSVWRHPCRKSFQTWATDTRNWGFRPSNHSSCHRWKSITARVPANRLALTWSSRTSKSQALPARWSTPWKSTWTTISWPARSASRGQSRSPDNTRSTAKCSCCPSPATDRAKSFCVSVVYTLLVHDRFNVHFFRFRFIIIIIFFLRLQMFCADEPVLELKEVLGTPNQKNGKTFVQVKKMDLKLIGIKKLNVKLENLFNGNKQLGECPGCDPAHNYEIIFVMRTVL